MRNLHEIPKFEDRWGHVYLEYGELDRDEASLTFGHKNGQTRIPIDQFAMLLMGPGTRITQGAVKALAESNCLVCWTGEEGVRMYAHGVGGTHSAHRLLRQAMLFADERERLNVARLMFQMRFDEKLDEGLTLQQLRGKEGERVRRVYVELALETGVEWKGRNYDQGNWDWADPLNRALSAANACLYGLCHAAILSAGYSAGIGFIHVGKMLSFVYDVADFYKTELTIPTAFQTVARGQEEVERRVRIKLREEFHRSRLMKRILKDIAEVLNAPDDLEERSGELEGRAVSLADRAGGGSLSGEPERPGEGQAVGKSAEETKKGIRPPDMD